jgi:hypothetical protein
MSSSSEFVFNQEVMLRDTAGRGGFDITVNLSTDKGNHIVAGVIKIDNEDLARHRGETLNFGLTNCLD